MRNRLFAIAVMATSGLSLAAAPVMAEAKARKVWVCDKNIRTKANNGTLIGAGVGAVAGHSVAKSRARNRHCHYVYR